MLKSAVWILTLAAAGVAVSACSGTKPSPAVSVAINGVTGTLTVGESGQLLAIVTKADGTKATLTGEATWQSANPAIATVSALGVVTAVAVGTVEIRATSQDATGSAQMVVPSVTSLAISGVRNPMAVGDTQQLQATALLSNNLKKNVTAQAAWSSAEAGVFTISSAGVLTAVGKGLTDVRAAYQGAAIATAGVVDQPGCTYIVPTEDLTLERGIITFPSNHALTVTTQPGCAWTVASDVDWMTVKLIKPGPGSGSFQLTTTFLDGPLVIDPRVGHLLVRWDTPTAGQNVSVTQTGACTVGLSELPSSPSRSFGSDGGNGLIEAYADVQGTPKGAAPWQVNSSVDWITVTSPTPGKWVFGGFGIPIQFTVSSNPSASPRTGSLVACKSTFTVTQAGR